MIEELDEEIRQAQETVDELKLKRLSYEKLTPVKKFATNLFLRYGYDDASGWDQEERNSNTWDLHIHQFWVKEAESIINFVKCEIP